MKKYIMSLDQGTTSSRCILFTKDGTIASMAQKEFPQIFPKEGYVEHDPMDIWSTQLSVATEALSKIDADFTEIFGIGITNQRETTIIWDKHTGKPIYNAIVWQCRRTSDYCQTLKQNGYSELIKGKTGLLPDPYFSATKIKWILDNVDGAYESAKNGDLCFGTVDTWLMWKLSGGKIHATDYSNASRTMLFNINTLEWDEELLSLFDIPRSILPKVLSSSGLFGYTALDIIGAAVPIAGVAGDQQAALFGQCCYNKGDVKNTYGTGAFLLMNTGDKPYLSDKGLLTTIAWGMNDKITYALEGSVFSCGATIQWLRDGLKVIDSAMESEHYASLVEDTGGVYIVPAFQGLGAPYWDPYARGTIVGITRGTTKNHIIRAAIESMAYQTADVVSLMRETSEVDVPMLSVDGGASANNLLLALQADISGIPIERPECIETTALGAAYLCGLALGVYSSPDEIKATKKTEAKFLPRINSLERKEKLDTWHKAIERSLNWSN